MRSLPGQVFARGVATSGGMYRPPLRKTRPMNSGTFIRRAIIACGAFLCAVGLFGLAFPLAGTPSRAWTLAAGVVLVLVGLAKGIMRSAMGSFEEAGPSMWTARADEDTPRNHGHAFGDRTGPLVNVDGTPMLNDCVDVAGKPYGDSGSTFNQDFGAGMWDSGSSGGFDSHHIGGNDW